jgi:hypothetical protein
MFSGACGLLAIRCFFNSARGVSAAQSLADERSLSVVECRKRHAFEFGVVVPAAVLLQKYFPHSGKHLFRHSLRQDEDFQTSMGNYHNYGGRECII